MYKHMNLKIQYFYCSQDFDLIKGQNILFYVLNKQVRFEMHAAGEPGGREQRQERSVLGENNIRC